MHSPVTYFFVCKWCNYVEITTMLVSFVLDFFLSGTLSELKRLNTI